MRTRLAVLTGGPCSGKTTTLGALQGLGFQILPEAALAVIEELNQSLGLEQQKSWRLKSPIEFQMMVAHKQAAMEENLAAVADEWAFLDRGMLDGLAYLRQAGVNPPAKLTEMAKLARYEKIFVLETLTKFEARPETGRMDTLDFSLQIKAHIIEVCSELGCQVIHVPECSVDERVGFILCEIEQG